MRRTMTMALALAAGCLTMPAAAAVIDDFSEGDFALSGVDNDGPDPLSAPGLAFEQRTAFLSSEDNAFTGGGNAGNLSVDNGAGAFEGMLAYNFASPGGAADLTDGGTSDRFAIDFDGVGNEAGGTVGLSLTVADVDGDAGTAMLPGFDASGAGMTGVGFAAFGPAVDFDRISFVTLSIASGDQVSIRFDDFRTDAAVVPVPAALPMMLGGLAGLGVLARRRRRVTGA